MSVCQHFFEKNIALSSSSCEHRGKGAPGGVKASLEKAADRPGSPSGSPYETKEDASFLQSQHLPLVGVFDLILLQSSGLFVISEGTSFFPSLYTSILIRASPLSSFFTSISVAFLLSSYPAGAFVPLRYFNVPHFPAWNFFFILEYSCCGLQSFLCYICGCAC